ncbi:MAG TPA: transglutaminase family protein [Ramlibacter sp.]|nr:transglutaminase family protein [Ramlibacter sp.]
MYELPEECLAWTHSTALMDLDDPRLRLKAHSLTQLCRNEREAVLALYAYVKRLPFFKTYKLRLHTARAVLDQQRGDADDKATLLVALLRSKGLAARVRYLAFRGELLRGLTTTISSIARPVVEVWLGGAWCGTDTYIFDASYLGGARRRLESEEADWGYGISRHGATLWGATGDAFLTGDPHQTPELFLGALGHYHDPEHFIQSAVCHQQFGGLTRLLQWNLLASLMEGTVAQVRNEGTHGRPADSVA